jgi:hypothetical protein
MDFVLQVLLNLCTSFRHELIDIEPSRQLIAALQKVENSVVHKQFN